MWWAVEKVHMYMTDLNLFMIIFFHSVSQLPCGGKATQDVFTFPPCDINTPDFSFCKGHLNVSVFLLT